MRGCFLELCFFSPKLEPKCSWINKSQAKITSRGQFVYILPFFVRISTKFESFRWLFNLIWDAGRGDTYHILAGFLKNSKAFGDALDTNHPWTAPSWTPWWALGLGAWTIYARAMRELWAKSQTLPGRATLLGTLVGLERGRNGRDGNMTGGADGTWLTGRDKPWSCKYNKNQSTSMNHHPATIRQAVRNERKLIRNATFWTPHWSIHFWQLYQYRKYN